MVDDVAGEGLEGLRQESTRLEAGNSQKRIFKHYQELVRPADARTWFSIAPGGEGKILEMPKPAAQVA